MEINRKLASVQRILDVKDIPDADRIVAYKVQGWWVVDQRGKYNIGDQVVYFEIDSWMPTNLAPFLSKGAKPREYMGVLGEKLRTIRLKKQLSQGLILPLDVIPVEPPPVEGAIPIFTDGEDVTDQLGILKWEEPVNAQLAGMARGNFPSFIPKTDQQRAQNIKREIEDNLDEYFEVTIKMDGSSMTVYNNEGLGVCSRKLDLKLDDESTTFVRLAKESGLLDAITGFNIDKFAIQGELMGPGIQGNRENLPNHQYFIFDIFDIDTQTYLKPRDRFELSARLVATTKNVQHCPVLFEAVKLRDIGTTIDELLEFAEGASLNHPVREGVVFKRLDGQFSFKAVSNRFLLEEK